MIDYRYMLMARMAGFETNCSRRGVGAVFKAGNAVFTGVNKRPIKCGKCQREVGDCGAIHAEMDALMSSQGWAPLPFTQLYLWAECPCQGCLSYIAKVTQYNCSMIHCLSAKSYAKEYKAIESRIDVIQERLLYASQLGIIVLTYDMEDILARKGKL